VVRVQKVDREGVARGEGKFCGDTGGGTFGGDVAKGREADKVDVDKGIGIGGKTEETWVGTTFCTEGETDGENAVLRRRAMDASSEEDAPGCVGGACKGGVAGGEGRVSRERGAEGDSGRAVANGLFRSCELDVA
jgi:hypothetical protein